MGQQLNRTRQYVGMTACALGTLSALMAPVSAFATTTTEVTGNEGTTEVTVKAAEGNIVFEVPTVIPFAAGGDGSLIVPDSETLQISNKSIFAIHVTNMEVTQEDPWTLVKDALDSDESNSIDFKVGPETDEKDAYNASQNGGTDLSGNAKWDMGYLGSGTESLNLSASGHISHVTEDLSADGSKVATITWTVEAGQHHV
ncbi:hypothetical protein H6A16_01960 [Collinsella tanakaei]|uniref:hypothetical protein n=1 Tax=Collinsella tanakaei TaxID=626935 RepID=UPI001958F180|nr:hypothetical protein [Collinsella tanakaei]MBM6778263.1 hypothetical protein [Collinsella tanakaei]